jgi:hypothetical protein
VVRPGAGAERSPRGVRLPAGRHLVQQRRRLRLLLQVRGTPVLYRKSDSCIPRNETARPRVSNSYIDVSVSDLYIPRIGLIILAAYMNVEIGEAEHYL